MKELDVILIVRRIDFQLYKHKIRKILLYLLEKFNLLMAVLTGLTIK